MAGIENNILFSSGQKLSPSSADDITRMQAHATDVATINHTGNPEGVIAANPSSLSHDPVSGVIYLKVSGTGNTGWSAIFNPSAPATITGNSGGALVPTLGNWNLLGSGSITVAGSGSTETFQLTGLTNNNVLVGAGTSTITKVPPSATAGIPLVSNGAAVDPSFSTALVPGGGTGLTSYTQGDLIYASAATTLVTLPKNVTATRYLSNTGTNNNPNWAQVNLTNGVTGALPVANGGTGLSSLTPYAVLTGGTTSTGNLQQVASLGTAGQLLTSNGAGALPTFQSPAGVSKVIRQVFISSGTYTPSTGMLYCDVEVIGGGGGGGGTAATSATTVAAGSGGGGGGYAKKVFTAATIGASQVVTVGAAGAAGAAGNNAGGAGGTSSLGALISATGGQGGSGSAAGGFQVGAGGAGGVGSGGDFNLAGNPGGAGFSEISVGVEGITVGGFGGWNLLSAGGLQTFDSIGAGGIGFGGGGGGASGYNSSAPARVGGAGTKGGIIITEYTT